MALTVFSPPVDFPEMPEFDYQDLNASEKREEAWVEQLKARAKSQAKGSDLVGAEVSFGVADGAARYLVWSERPLRLIHLPTGDAYRFNYIERLTLADIRTQAGLGRRTRKSTTKPQGPAC